MRISLGLAAFLALVGPIASAQDWKPDAGAIPGRPKGATAPAPEDRETPDGRFFDDIALAALDKPDKTQVWAEDEGNKGFDAETRAKVRILSNNQHGMKHYLVVFHPSLGVHDNRFEFAPMVQNVRLLQIRGVGKYLATEYSTSAQYFDLRNFANYVQHVYDADLQYQMAGSYSAGNGQMQNVTDVEIAADVLTHDLKVDAADPMLPAIRERAKKNAKAEAYVLNGDRRTIYLGFGEVGMTIWPAERRSGDSAR